jgi:putative zinc finger protein
MHHWMYSCKEVTQMVSESLDHKLPLVQRIGIRVHLLMCKFCSRYRKQLLILREAMRLQEKYIEDTTLPTEARERIKRSFTYSLNKSQ